MLDAALNAVIFLVTAVINVQFFYKEKVWRLSNGISAYRFFTVLSNDLCAIAALCMCFAPADPWVWTLKYISTAAVSVTMLTVLAFLGPTQGYKRMLAGQDFFLHLLTPLLAIASFCLLEKRGMSFGFSLLGMLPVLLYGPLYLYKILLAPESRRWEDFYGFNKGGHWQIAMAAMLAGSFVISMVFWFLQNL